MNSEKKIRYKVKPFIILVLFSILLPIAASAILMGTYPVFKQKALEDYSNTMRNQVNTESFIQSSYILYKNLYERINETKSTYAELYFPEIKADLEEDDFQQVLIGIEEYFQWVKGAYYFSQVEECYEYFIQDNTSGDYIGNPEMKKMDSSDYARYIELDFNSTGNVSITDVTIGNTNNNHSRYESSYETTIIDIYNHGFLPEHVYSDLEGNSDYLKFPGNFKVIYGLPKSIVENKILLESPSQWGRNSYDALADSGLVTFIKIFFLGLLALAIILPLKEYGRDYSERPKLFKLPLEVTIGIFLLLFFNTNYLKSTSLLMGGYYSQVISNYFGIFSGEADIYAYIWHGTGMLILFLIAWYCGLCLRPITAMGMRAYCRKSSFLYCRFDSLKAYILRFYHSLESFNLTKKANKTIWILLIVNALILMLISSLWFIGFFLILIYSLILYMILRKYISRLQLRYGILLGKINQISNGNLNVEIPEELGVFESLKPHILNIQSGFRNAVVAETKSSKMKAELITNVSHDLKTPLTAIITYVDLLKDETITPEQRKEYVDTLERKSARLKVLIEDLFEVSKVTSGNLVLMPEEVDICHLLKQVALEWGPRLETAKLDLRMKLPDVKIITWLDSQRTYRIYENLLSNITKYSLPGTRVHINCYNQGANVLVEMKNISSAELSLRPEELTDRFVRGDESRNTEGSGLGLAIAKSLTDLQGGHFQVEIDGDLFKVVTVFPLRKE